MNEECDQAFASAINHIVSVNWTST